MAIFILFETTKQKCLRSFLHKMDVAVWSCYSTYSVTYDKMIFLQALLKSPFSYYKSMLMLHSKYNFCSEEK